MFCWVEVRGAGVLAMCGWWAGLAQLPSTCQHAPAPACLLLSGSRPACPPPATHVLGAQKFSRNPWSDDDAANSAQVAMGMPPVQKAALAMLPKLAPSHLPQVRWGVCVGGLGGCMQAALISPQPAHAASQPHLLDLIYLTSAPVQLYPEFIYTIVRLLRPEHVIEQWQEQQAEAAERAAAAAAAPHNFSTPAHLAEGGAGRAGRGGGTDWRCRRGGHRGGPPAAPVRHREAAVGPGGAGQVCAHLCLPGEGALLGGGGGGGGGGIEGHVGVQCCLPC